MRTWHRKPILATMFAPSRAACLALLFTLLDLPACAPPEAAAPPPPAQHRRRAVRRAVAAALPRSASRPSESESVADEITDPRARQLFEARLSEPGMALGPTLTAPRVTATALENTARGEAPDTQPMGPVSSATLAEGQHADMPVVIGPRECTTFIAQGGLGVIEVDLFLSTGGGSGRQILAEDPRSGPIAVVGGHGRCFQNRKQTSLDAVLHVTVRRGSGVVLVRGYRKN